MKNEQHNWCQVLGMCYNSGEYIEPQHQQIFLQATESFLTNSIIIS